MGWPLALRPPEGFTGILPPRLVQPFSAATPPAPGSNNPSPSVATISAMVKQSWSSTTSTSVGDLPAWRYAAAAARSVAGTPEIALLVHEHGVGGGLAGEGPHRARALARNLLGGENEGGAPVGEGAAVEELEGIGDVRALEHGVDGDFLLELCLRIQDPVPVVL